ncbi:hypothetical protein GQ457_09G013180 [Hibiscus cannabinus]
MEIRNEIGKEEEKSLPTFSYGGRRRLRTPMADPDGQKVASRARNDISQNGLDPTVNNEDLIPTRFGSCFVRVHQRSETFIRDERLLKQEEENLEGDVDLRLQEVEKCRVISKRSQSSPPSHHHLRSNEVVTGANVGSYKEILEIRG